LSSDELKHVPSLPGSLEEALRALEKDHAFLTKGDVFHEEFLRLWIDYKMAKEINPMRMRPHPFEFMLYYDI
jgi:glutamine synthetase